MTDIVPPLCDRPAHYRLKDGTWEVILKEYVEGATGPELALKWRVSEHALRKRITEHGMTKRDWGDSQAIVQAAMRADELAEARANGPEAQAQRTLKGLFAPASDEDRDACDPAALAREATLASGRAMKGRLWVEARALAGLAESYARLADRQAAVGMNAYNVPLRVVAEVLDDQGGAVSERLRIDPARTFDPDLPVKLLWRERCREVSEAVAAARKDGLSEEAAWREALSGPPPKGRGRRAGSGLPHWRSQA